MAAAKAWADHFEDSLRSCKMPIPPKNLYSTAGIAIGSLKALLDALKVVSSSKDTMTLKVLITSARQTSLRVALGASTVGELLNIAGGVMAALYIGALIGAALYATEKTNLGWSDAI